MRHQKMSVLAARAAALERKAGKRDPLSDVREITPELLSKLGVKEAEIQQAVLGGYRYWVDVLGEADPEAALELVEKLTQLSHSGPVEPRTLAGAWLAAARIHYEQKERARALAFTVRALLVRPSLVGRDFLDLTRRAVRVRLWHPLLNFTRPIRHALGLRQTVKATDKQKVLLRNGLRDATWVETGTYMGDTTSVLSKVAKMVYSIEPEPALFSKAEQRFSNTSNVKIIKGLSEDVFPKLLPTLSGNVCFWLDGHYSAGITFKGPQETPIIDELTGIGRNITQMGKVVVMVDDVRCFDPSNPEFSAYPPVGFLVDWARKHNLTWHIEQDIFIAKNH
jgi:hypothetical protein